MSQHFDVIICGAGSIGVAATYYLAQQKGIRKVLLVDKHAPLSQTSAKSGENYRNWWPQEVMVRFTNRSIDLMDALADESGNVFQMSRRGYAYVSSQAEARDGVLATVDHYGRLDVGQVRVHEAGDQGVSY
ncbi:MAG: FAD-dependent oxidoreductase, partial [Ardenticatenaceae bacterium]